MQSSKIRSKRQQPVGSFPAVSEGERRAILSVADALIGRAGRTTLAMALRGSRAKRVLQYAGVEGTRGHGYFAGRPEADVLARVDALIHEGVLAIEYHDDFPLIGYTPRGLRLAMQYVADEWLEVVRSRVRAVSEGGPLDLPFLMSVMPQRNHDTVFMVIDDVAREADPGWLPLLKAWNATETRRVRERLKPIITRFEAQAKGS